MRRLADLVERPSERLRLMIVAYADGAFRAVDAMWIAESDSSSVRSLAQLRGLLAGWDGGCPTRLPDAVERSRGGTRPVLASRLARVVAAPKAVEPPAPYEHPSGAVIWVRLPDMLEFEEGN